jgi:hypothetical protein
MGFSSILDISSFFIGMIINLIFVALMCYYFKRKYDYLYEAQCEQSKIIYQLIHKPTPTSSPLPNPGPSSMDFTSDPLVKLNRIDSGSVINRDSDSESDSDSDSDDEMDVTNHVLHTDVEELNTEDVKMIDLEPESHLKVEEVKLDEPFEITVNLADDAEPSETNYSKMSMKQLKEVLSSKGIKPKNNIKKEDLIELLTKDVS